MDSSPVRISDTLALLSPLVIFLINILLAIVVSPLFDSMVVACRCAIWFSSCSSVGLPMKGS